TGVCAVSLRTALAPVLFHHRAGARVSVSPAVSFSEACGPAATSRRVDRELEAGDVLPDVCHGRVPALDAHGHGARARPVERAARAGGRRWGLLGLRTMEPAAQAGFDTRERCHRRPRLLRGWHCA